MEEPGEWLPTIRGQDAQVHWVGEVLGMGAPGQGGVADAVAGWATSTWPASRFPCTVHGR